MHRSVGLAAAVLLAAATAACSSGSGGSAAGDTPSATAAPTGQGGVMTATAQPSATAGTATATQLGTGRSVDVTVSGRTVSPAPAEVPVSVGQPVTLKVTSDASGEVHLDAIGLVQPVSAGVPATVLFVAAKPGDYEVRLSNPDLRLLTFVAG